METPSQVTPSTAAAAVSSVTSDATVSSVTELSLSLPHAAVTKARLTAIALTRNRVDFFIIFSPCSMSRL
jgi:hypothetical protein